MKNILLMLMIVILSLIAAHSNCLASDIKEGTYSIGASSNALWQTMEYDDEQTTKDLNLFAEFGYFILDNIEIGATVGLSYFDTDNYDIQRLLVTPYLMCHFSLSDRSNIYIGAGIGMGRSYYDTDSDYGSNLDDFDTDTTYFYVESGWEYFLSSSVAFNWGIRAQQFQYESDYSDGTTNGYGTELRLKLYF